MRKIILICSAGMSTSMLVERMKEYAAATGYECSIDAFPVTSVKEAAEDADIVLLGPQVSFKLDEVKEKVTCPAEVIDMVAYGMMNGEAVIKRVKEVLDD